MKIYDRIILGIETSCDDTSLCLVGIEDEQKKVLALNSFSQDFILSKWGGVVPELAARSHVKAIPPLLEITFKEAGVKLDDVSEIAVTTHPGLVGSLLTGINLAKTIALIKKIPITPVNHLYCHLEAIQIESSIPYPYLGLVISGGHTAFFMVHGPNKMDLLGNTLDDAAGEAFDKGGKLMGIGYPAGRLIDEMSKSADNKKFNFPISYLRDRPGKLSFSGLKTALRVKLEKMSSEEIQANLSDIAGGYQEAIVQTLKIKTIEVIEKVLLKDLKSFNLPIVVGGGVAANSRLRQVLGEAFNNIHFVPTKYCADNAAMIANWAALAKNQSVPFPECLSIDASSRFVEKI